MASTRISKVIGTAKICRIALTSSAAALVAVIVGAFAYTEVVNAKPAGLDADSRLFVKVGNSYLARGDFQDAITCFAAQVDRTPGDATAQEYLAYALHASGSKLQPENICSSLKRPL